jgi:lipopolysaccharide/colanic/teichoic acid biosynthesis glycosyltransferase
VIRRAVDVAVSAAVLALASPLLAAVAIAVRLTSPGPVLYRQPRAGLHGRPFEVVKFRTMVEGAEFIGSGMAIDEGDARITRVGALLRRTSIDELPNLINVLRGEMSLIGPRPTLLSQIESYDERQRHRLDVKPGITGWAQVNGRASLPWSERIELDLHYVEHRSLRLDALILRRTLRVLLHGGGVYRGERGDWDL